MELHVTVAEQGTTSITFAVDEKALVAKLTQVSAETRRPVEIPAQLRALLSTGRETA